MSWLKWIKTAANVSTGGLSSLYLYGGLLVVGMALAGGAFVWHGAQVEAARFKAFKAGNDEVQAEWDSSENEKLRETQRELTRLITFANNLNEAYREQSKEIDDLERIAVTAGVRVTKAQRDAAIAQGSAEAVRHYASTAGDVYQACRDEYRALGYEAARGSSAAHALNVWVENYPPAKEFQGKLADFKSQLKGN